VDSELGAEGLARWPFGENEKSKGVSPRRDQATGLPETELRPEKEEGCKPRP
jgi:hypothetical protein